MPPRQAQLTGITQINFGSDTDRFTFRIGVQNLFDKDPPLVGADAGATDVNAANTFPTVYDSLGRTFFAGVTAKF